MSEEQKLWLEFFSPIATIVTALIGVLAIMWQVRKQSIYSLELQKSNIQQDIKRKLYAEVIEVIEKAEEAQTRATGIIRNIEIQYISAKTSLEAGIAHSGLSITAKDILERRGDFTSSVIKLVSLIERYEIIEPRIKIFQIAIGFALDTASECFNQFYMQALKVLPFADNNNAGKALPRAIPSQLDYEKLMNLGHAYIKPIDLLGCYISDFRIEMQNLLLGELFSNKVNKRIPIDPYYNVINIDNYDQLNDYFDNTDWGKRIKEISEDCKSEFEPKP